MLKAIGASSIAELFDDIPRPHRDPRLDLPPALSELELRRELQALSNENAHGETWPSFLGGGAYRHYIPSIVWHLAGRSEFATSYTPYQPEVSQGVLQASYEFQTMVCHILGMEVANTGMYDGATALAEAALMACRITRRDVVLALDTVSPRNLDVVRTYVEPQGIQVQTTSAEAPSLSANAACLLAQSPNFLGCLEDQGGLSETAHAAGALYIASVDPISLGMFRPPGDYGADIAVSEGQPLGIPLSYGGPYVGLFACKPEHLRQMPGRITGRTRDRNGETGYVLTLQTREQHIRRERATSNICTSETLVAIAVAVYLAAMGRHGLREVAQQCYHKAHYAADAIGALPGFSLAAEKTFFKEFVVRCPKPPAEINAALRERHIIGGAGYQPPSP